MNNGIIERLFHLKESKTTLKTELLAGLTTFLAMAYILAVNPAILGVTGMDKGGVFVATALAAFAGTIIMAFSANLPLLLAPGMGLNAYFAYTVVAQMGYSWQIALFAVFLEGFIFLILSLTKVREAIFNAIPAPLKTAVGVGIGLFIAFIALQNAHIIVNNDATLVSFQHFTKENISTHGISAILAMVGVLIIAFLNQKKIRGSILIGILVTWGLGIIAQLTGLYQIKPELGCHSMLPTLSVDSMLAPFHGFGKLFGQAFNVSAWTLKGADVSGGLLVGSVNFLVVMFAFLFVDLFDTLGVLIGVCGKADMLDKDGRLPQIRGALLSDSIATSVGALFGTSTTTAYLESATGVSEGGRTGLTAVTGAILFLVALLFAPIFLAIPAFATAPALIMVGLYMMEPIRKIDFSNLYEALPAYVTIISMPFAYSISEGICLGVIAWALLNFAGRTGKNTPLIYVLAVLFILKYIFL